MQEDDRSLASGSSTPSAAAGPEAPDTERRAGSRRAERPVDAESTVLMAAISADVTSQTYSGGRRAKSPVAVPGSRRSSAPVDVPRRLPAAAPHDDAESTMIIPAISSIPGSRRVSATRSSRRGVSTVVAGAAAVAIAALGSLGVGPSVSVLAGEDASLAQSYVGTKNATNAVDVSRNYDRELAVQKPLQAKQIATARAGFDASTLKRNDARADEIVKNTWVLPVVGYRLTARFGQSGGLWSSGMHTGLDFAGPSGSPISAVAGGVVTSAGYEGSYGNRTIITLPDGTEIWYCHQTSFSVSVGQQVAPGDPIGLTGATGNVTGPHLHLEVHPGGGAAVDPFTALVAHGVNP